MLQRFVDLRAGEARPVLRATGILGLVVAAHTLLETARDTLFLSKLPVNRLAWVYALLAVLSLAASAAAGRFAAVFGRRAALVFSLAISAFVVVLFYIRPPTPMGVFALYVTSGVLVTVLTLQFWMFLAELFTVAEGKRLFGPIASGGVLGAVAGASLAAVALRRMAVPSLLLCAAVLFLGAAGLVAGTKTAALPAEPTVPRGPLAFLGDASEIVRDRYVLLLGALMAVGTAAVLVADYLFKSAAAARFEPAELGRFFAGFYAANNALALIVQLFLTAALVRRLGVPGAATVLPIALAGSGVLAVLGGGFFLAVLAKGADGTLRHSLHRVTSELLLLPVAPARRARVKPFLETVFGRGTQALTAGVILLLSARATPHVLAVMLAGLALVWVLLSWRARKPYVNLFRQALASGNLDVRGTVELDLASVEILMQNLSSRDDDRVLAAIEILVESGHPGLLPALVLAHESPRVLQRALVVLSKGERRDWVERAEGLFEHPDVGVRATAVQALLATGHEEAARRGLGDASGTVRALAAFYLANRDTAHDPFQDQRVQEILHAEGLHALDARQALLGVIGADGTPRWASVVEAIVRADGERPLTPAHAAPAIARSQALDLVPFLIRHLAAREARGSVREALVALGAPAFEALEATLADETAPTAIRAQVPKVLAGFGTQAAIDTLTFRYRNETVGALRYKILRGLGRIDTEARDRANPQRLRFERSVFRAAADRNLIEHVRLLALRVAFGRGEPGPGDAVAAVLTTLLEDKASQALERAFRCLQLAHRNENLRLVHSAVIRGTPQARSNAMEFLDSLPGTSPEGRGLLRLIADHLTPDDVVARAREILRPLGVAEPPHERAPAIPSLLADPDDLVAALTAYYVLAQGSESLLPVARRALQERPSLALLGAARV